MEQLYEGEITVRFSTDMKPNELLEEFSLEFFNQGQVELENIEQKKVNLYIFDYNLRVEEEE